MRKTFYELLESKDFDVSEEYNKLLELFTVEDCVPVYNYLKPVNAYIDAIYFRELPFRGSYTSLEELMNEIGLPTSSDQLDDLYLFCEFLIAVLPSEKTKKDRYLLEQSNTILGNITYILEKTNHELRDDKNGNPIIVSKNQASVLAAEIVEDDDVSFDLIEYNHYALKGNLSEKKKILASIGVYIEPILKNRTLQDSTYKTLLSDTGFVFNNFNIRHNNITGAKEQEYIKNLNDSELEAWYDKAYDLAIAVIIASECSPVQDEISELKKKYKWKT